MPIHQRPGFSSRQPPPSSLLELASTWAESEFQALHDFARNSLFYPLCSNLFDTDGLIQRAYISFALRAIHAVTYAEIATGNFHRRPPVSHDREGRAARDLRLTRQLLKFLSGAPETPRHPHFTKLNPEKIFDCLIEEYCEPLADAQSKWVPANIIEAESLLQNPSHIFHALLTRHRLRRTYRDRRRPLDQRTALELPPRFLNTTYQFLKQDYAVLSLETPKDLRLASTIASNCLHHACWETCIRQGRTVVLCVSRLLAEPEPTARPRP